MEATTYAERLAEALGVPAKFDDWTRDDRARVQRLADHLDISYSGMSRYFKQGYEERMLAADNHMRASRFLKVDPMWLATGDGSKRGFQAWPFGDEISPADFYALGADAVQPAIDVIKAAIARHKETLPRQIPKVANGGG